MRSLPKYVAHQINGDVWVAFNPRCDFGVESYRLGQVCKMVSKGDNLEIMALPVKANQVPQACRFIIAIDPESHCNN